MRPNLPPFELDDFGPSPAPSVVRFTRSSLFRFSADRLPVAIFLALFALDILVFATVSVWPLVLVWAALSVPAKVCIAAWNHHHQHVPFFRSTTCNRLMEVVFGLQTGAISNVWVLHHNLGHHDHYMDQSKDESAWRARGGRVMSTIEYTWKFAFTGYSSALHTGARHPAIRRTFLRMLILHMAILGALL